VGEGDVEKGSRRGGGGAGRKVGRGAEEVRDGPWVPPCPTIGGGWANRKAPPGPRYINGLVVYYSRW